MSSDLVDWRNADARLHDAPPSERAAARLEWDRSLRWLAAAGDADAQAALEAETPARLNRAIERLRVRAGH